MLYKGTPLGAGGALGLGTAIARGGAALARTSGVSDGFGEAFLCGVGDFSPIAPFFFFDFSGVSLAGLPAEALAEAGLFFGFGCVVASGVSLAVGDASDSSAVFFFVFVFGFGEGESEVRAALALDGWFFFFLCADAFAFGVGVADSSLEVTARAFRIRVGFSSSVCCA